MVAERVAIEYFRALWREAGKYVSALEAANLPKRPVECIRLTERRYFPDTVLLVLRHSREVTQGLLTTSYPPNRWADRFRATRHGGRNVEQRQGHGGKQDTCTPGVVDDDARTVLATWHGLLLVVNSI